ncbi:MAG: AraC family transcriptional regulator, partial [Acidobacteriota bacterium]
PYVGPVGRWLGDALWAGVVGWGVVYEFLAGIFLVNLPNKYSDRVEDSVEYAQGYSSRQHRRVLALVERRYSEDIAVDDLAGEAQLSPSHFSRLFKRSLGQSPHQFLMSYRVEKAGEALLGDPARPIVQVALDAGFSDQAHFSRTFKRLVGLTPSAFRESRR